MPLNFMRKECRTALDEWERSGGAEASSETQLAALSKKTHEHLLSCAACMEKMQDAAEVRKLLEGAGQTRERESAPSAYFASSVMEAIRAQEAELEEAARTWAFLPKWTLRLAEITVLLVLLASAWMYLAPRRAAERPSVANGATSVTPDGLFERSPTPSTKDEVLVSLVERAR